MTRNQRGEADLPPGPARDLVNLFRLLRSRRPLTVGQIAIKSHLAAGHVSEVLRGWKAPSPNAAEALARALGADDGTALKARSLAEALGELNRYTRARERIAGSGARLDALERSRLDALRRLVAGYTRSAAAASAAITPSRFMPAGAGEQVTADPVKFDDTISAMAWCQAEAGLIPQLCALAYDLGFDAECWRLAYAMREYFFTVKAVEPWIASHRIALLAAERSGDLWAQAVTRNNLGMALTEQGHARSAAAQYHRALEMLSVLGDERGMATTLGHQAWANYAAGRHGAAISLAERANALNGRHDNGRSLAIMDRIMALSYSKTGRHREALRSLAECQEILSGLALPLDEVMTLNCLGEVHCAIGDFSQAREFHALAAERSAACGGLHEENRAVAGLAVIARATRSTHLANLLPAGRPDDTMG